MKVYLIYLFLLINLSVSAQVYSLNKEVYLAYNEVLEKYEKPFSIATHTRNKELKKFNFKHPEHHQLDTSNIKPLNSNAWRTFLLSIDTSQIKEYNLKSLKQNRGRLKTLLNNNKNKRFLTLASPIFSADRRLCICYIASYTSPENNSGSAYFLEKQDKKWKVVKTILIHIA